jgi:site-specific DNA recombinase
MPSYVIYCRKSSESEERQVLSIESQIKEVTELAGRLNIQISETLTESQSAKSPGRPVFNALMDRVYKGEVRGIVTWKLDRLARNPIDGSAVIWAVDQGKLQEIVTPSATYRNNSNDKFLMQLDLGMAKKYVDDLSDNVKRGNKTKLEKGWLPGKAPLGYLNEPRERTIVPDPERFALVRKMWDLLLQGIRPSRILEIATDEWGLNSQKGRKAGNKPLCLSGIYKIFSNPFYYGLIQRREGVFPGKHQKLITEDEYWRAQEMLGRKGKPRPQAHEFAFTGLMRCGECGCMITAEEKRNRYGHHYAYYRCTKKSTSRRCRQKYVNVKDLETEIMGYLDRIHVPAAILDMALTCAKQLCKKECEEAIAVQRSHVQALARCERKLGNLNQMRLSDLIDDEEYRFEKGRLIAERLSLEEKTKSGHTSGNDDDRIVDTLTFASVARDRFQNGSLEDKRAILTRIGSNLLLKDQKLLFQAKKPFIILENGLKAIAAEKDTLEPAGIGYVEPRIRLSFRQIQLTQAVVEDVRTFCRETRRLDAAA